MQLRKEVLVLFTRYDGRTIWFHWLVALLVPLQWAMAQVIDWFRQGTPRVDARSVHISVGLLIGVLLALRIIWRMTRGRVLPPADRGAMQFLAKSLHYTLYGLLIVSVLIGVFLVYVRGDSFFGFFTVPAFDPGNKALRHDIGELHSTIATIVLILAAFHASAGLVHHYLWRDGVLRRMLPARD
ncbi:MAG TPA: cytochrome b [Methylocella sp.]|nr:cytochrome b [Methylocella sp.]